MNVAEAKAAAREERQFEYPNSYRTRRAARVLADEVDRLEAQLDSVRAELAATAARIAAWDEALDACLPALREQMMPERARCNCGFGGFHDDANPRCERNLERAREAGL